MKRAVPSFTVEVRRRRTLATTSKPDVQLSETKPPQAVGREPDRAAAAVFGAKKIDRSPAYVAASHPTRRILPSLVPDEPWHRQLVDAPVSTANSGPPSQGPKRPAVREPKGGEQASKLPQTSSCLSDENARLAERSSIKSHRMSRVQSDDGAGATPKDPTRAPSSSCRRLRRSRAEGKRSKADHHDSLCFRRCRQTRRALEAATAQVAMKCHHARCSW